MAGVALFRIGRDLRYEWVFNPQFADSLEEVVGTANTELFPPEDASLLDRLFIEAFNSRLPQAFDMRLRCLKTGQERLLEMLLEPIWNGDGEVEALSGVALDLSPEVERQGELRIARALADEVRRESENARREAEGERIQAEDARAEAIAARKLAEEANRAKTRFMAAAGHDLRQPIQAMAFFQSVIVQRFKEYGDEPGLKAAAALGSAVSSVDDLLNLLTDLATLEAGEVSVHIESFPPLDVVRDCVSELSGLAQAKGLLLRVRPCAVMIRSDRLLLKRIVRNLLTNAIKYTDRGGILVGFRRRGISLRIEVWDTGRGIAEDKLAHIFEEFYRVDESLDPGGGLGIGLSVVAKMARLLGHEVMVRSREGRGSLFAVTVPLASRRNPPGSFGWRIASPVSPTLMTRILRARPPN